MSILSTSHLDKHFGGNRAVNDVSFEVPAGGVNLLIGANGSGKTTLVNLISGMVRADAGKVFFGGQDITGLTQDKIFRMGMIRTFQTPRLFSNLSVLENLLVARTGAGESFSSALMYGRWQGEERQTVQKAFSIMQSLGLAERADGLAYDLSGGQVKLLELGKTLMSEPRLVLLDEPIAGINPVLARDILSRISNTCREVGTTFLIIEHRLDIALKYADRVFVMGEGEMIAEGGPDEILDDDRVLRSYLGR